MQDGIGRNSDLLTEALEHANELEARSANLKSEVDNAKSPAARTLEAANAYSDIAEGLTNGTDLAMSALQTADEAASMVGIHILLHSNFKNHYFHFCRFRHLALEIRLLKHWQGLKNYMKLPITTKTTSEIHSSLKLKPRHKM